MCHLTLKIQACRSNVVSRQEGGKRLPMTDKKYFEKIFTNLLTTVGSCGRITRQKEEERSVLTVPTGCVRYDKVNFGYSQVWARPCVCRAEFLTSHDFFMPDRKAEQ